MCCDVIEDDVDEEEFEDEESEESSLSLEETIHRRLTRTIRLPTREKKKLREIRIKFVSLLF